MRRSLLTTAVLLAVLVPSLPAAAQQADGADDAPSNGAVDDVLDAINKMSSPPPEGPDWSAPVKIAVIFAALAVLPSLLVMVTSFTRIVIVLAFIRRALTTQNIPPTVAIIGLALFLTLFTMAPTFGVINERAVQPYVNDEITFPEAISESFDALKEFMLRQTRNSDLALFTEIADLGEPQSVEDLPMHVVVPSFAISEFRTAFEMGCLIFIPFLMIDLVTAGILLSAGMMMLPPVIISLPFKIILFVLVDGWQLVARTLVSSFN
ncbi:MAG: flagellar type III secretion system pore protein FliP [Phycisphaerae bacterium]